MKDLTLEEVLDRGYESEIYEYAKLPISSNYEISLLQKAILDTYNHYYIYIFARDVKGANIELLQEGMRGAYPKYIYWFAKDVKGANIEVLQDYLISELGEGYDDGFRNVLLFYISYFANGIKEANINKMISGIERFVDEYYANGNVYHNEICDMRMDDYIEELVDFADVLKDTQKNKELKLSRKETFNNNLK